MDHETAGPELQRRLGAVGFRLDAPRLSVLWPILADWAACPVDNIDDHEADTDTLLFEGILDLQEPSKYVPHRPSFTLSFVRQLLLLSDALGRTVAEGRVEVVAAFKVTDQLRSISVMRRSEFGVADSFWDSGGVAAGSWAARVEATRSFQIASLSEAFAVTIRHRSDPYP